MSVKGFKNYDEEGNFLGVEKYDYGSLEGIPKNFKNDTYEQDIKQLKTDVEKNVTDHNVSKDAHNDIRLLITEIINRINVIADSDDETLDQMSELVAYIKNNKTLIDSITTSKVNVSDIVNDLTTNVSNKPLSAEQGVVLKTLIDNLTRDLDTHGLSGNHIPTGGSSGQILKWLSSGKAQWANETVYASTTHKHSASDVNSGTLPIARGGTGGTTLLEASSSLGFPSLVKASYISKNTDLDTMGTPGTYYCYPSSDVKTLVNCPTENAFIMYIEGKGIQGTSQKYSSQIIRDNNGNVYIRSLRVGTDTSVSWKCIAGGDININNFKFYGAHNVSNEFTTNILFYDSLGLGFVLSYSTPKLDTEYLKKGDVYDSVSSGSNTFKYRGYFDTFHLYSIVKTPDGVLHHDYIEAYMYSTSTDSTDGSGTKYGLCYKAVALQDIPKNSIITIFGVFPCRRN